MKFLENWGNGKLDISDMAVVAIFLSVIGSLLSVNLSFKKKPKRKKA